MTRSEGAAAVVREVPEGDTALAYDAMAELRPHVESVEDFVARVDGLQRPEGYELVAAFVPDVPNAVAAAGWRPGHNLSIGHYIYVDDLVAAAAYRGRGYAGLLMDWLVRKATSLGCDQVHLDSATHRHVAHRFYLKRGMDITAFHFNVNISSEDAD
jgi:GNAT superfamily N-acetyltransferase